MNLHGTTAELRFIEWLLKQGCDVMVPFHTPGCAADVAWRNLKRGEHHWVCAQVKKTYVKKGEAKPSANLTRSNNDRYHVSDADFLAAVNYVGGCLWLIPFHRVCDVGRITLGEKWEGYKHEL